MSINRDTGLASRIIFLTLFGIAMGFLEASVVVYLRELYYPEGFAFPLKPMALEKLSIEYLREISTIAMLFSFSIVAGKNFPERLSIFLYSFGTWDIFYYIWLKVLLDWPSSILTWDILFLIPVVWVGPVLAPILCSLTMIGIAGCIFYFNRKGYPVIIHSGDWVFLISGALLISLTFVLDYSKIIIQRGFVSHFLTLEKNYAFQEIISHYIPITYNWFLFAVGEVLIVFSLLLFWRRMKGYDRNNTKPQ